MAGGSYGRSAAVDLPGGEFRMGSDRHLCSPSYCLRYRPAARRPQMIDTGMSHLGFRCAWPA